MTLRDNFCARFQDDDTGLFISKLTGGGPAMVAGLRVGDKLLRVNKTDVVNVCHQVCYFSLLSCLLASGMLKATCVSSC